MEEWRTYKVGELVTFQNGFAFKSSDFTSAGRYPVVKIKEIKSGKVVISNDTSYVNNSVSKYRIEKDDILFALTGDPVGRPNPGSWVGRVAKYGLDDIAYLNQRVCKISQYKSELLNPKFLYYYFLLHENHYALASKATGSASQANISTKTIEDVELAVPSLRSQNAIVALLDSIEQKIDLNNRINHNLEEQAQALYKSWFIDFEPFKDGKFVESEFGLIPEKWEVVYLDTLSSIISRGFSPKYSDTSKDVVLGQRCVRNNMIDLSVSRTHIPKNLGERELRQYDILINSTGMGSLGRVAQIYFKPERMTYDSHLTLVRSKSPNLEMYIGRNLLSRQDEIENMAVGSTGQTELPRDSVKEMRILLPDEATLGQFGIATRALTCRMQSNLQENAELIAMRDSLLPKLMSGELNINEIDC